MYVANHGLVHELLDVGMSIPEGPESASVFKLQQCLAGTSIVINQHETQLSHHVQMILSSLPSLLTVSFRLDQDLPC